ncbi:hypothetical protein BH11ARM2_BH11ARM2_03250 [soil metagenome]
MIRLVFGLGILCILGAMGMAFFYPTVSPWNANIAVWLMVAGVGLLLFSVSLQGPAEEPNRPSPHPLAVLLLVPVALWINNSYSANLIWVPLLLLHPLSLLIRWMGKRRLPLFR